MSDHTLWRAKTKKGIICLTVEVKDVMELEDENRMIKDYLCCNKFEASNKH